MKVLVLSALGLDASFGDATLSLLEEALAERRHQVETVDCERLHVSPCTGCGSCGLRTPGRCVVDDDMQEVFRKIVASEMLVLATPVRFGSYCAELKKVVDRFQPLMVPLYVTRRGEMHFRARYDLPALVGVGLLRGSDRRTPRRMPSAFSSADWRSTSTSVMPPRPSPAATRPGRAPSFGPVLDAVEDLTS